MAHKHKECSLLQAFYDGQLGQEDIPRMKEHMEQCPYCQQDIHVLNRMSDMLRLTQAHEPEKEFFSQVWERVEQHIVRDRLSLVHVAQKWISEVFYYLQMGLRPAIAVSFILFLAVLPRFEKQDEPTPEVRVAQSEVKRIQSSGPVMVLQTKESKMTIIWVIPKIVKQEGQDHAL